MDPSRAAVLAVATMFGLLVLARGEGARASAISLRPAPPHAPATAEARCAPGSLAARNANAPAHRAHYQQEER